MKNNTLKSHCTRRAVSSEALDDAIYLPLTHSVLFGQGRHDIGHLVALLVHTLIVVVKFNITAVVRLKTHALKPFYQFPVKIQYLK